MTTIIILGLRSGTSLITSMLQAVGIYIGVNFASPSINNKYGNFEEKDIKAENDDILVFLGKTSPYSTVTLSELEKLPFRFLLACKETIQKHSKDIWAIKNPMLVWTLPIWDVLVENPRYIFCTRDRESQQKSLEKMAMGESIDDIKLWMDTYWNTARQYLEGKKYIEVDFDDMYDNSEQTFKRVLEFLDYSVDVKPALEKINRLERHFKKDK